MLLGGSQNQRYDGDYWKKWQKENNFLKWKFFNVTFRIDKEGQEINLIRMAMHGVCVVDSDGVNRAHKSQTKQGLLYELSEFHQTIIKPVKDLLETD